MRAKVTLLSFKGCPNVDQARENLRAALRRLGWPTLWEEVDLESSGCLENWRGFPSPTVLVEGSDVATGLRSQAGTPACRFGGAPSVDLIAQKLSHRRSGRWLSTLAALPAAAIGLFPAAFCPACYPALAGLLSAVGLGTFASDAVLKPLTVILLFLAIAGLAHQSWRTKRWLPSALGVLGALGMYAGMYVAPNAPLKWSGIGVLVGSSLWNLIPTNIFRSAGGPSCSACQGGKENA